MKVCHWQVYEYKNTKYNMNSITYRNMREKTLATWNRNRIKKECIRCGKVYYSPFSKQKYCSRDCCDIVWNEKKDKTEAFYRIRFSIFERDGFRCKYCGRSSIEDGVVLEIDHINPRNGEKPKWLNSRESDLITSCKDCNIGKSNFTLTLPILKRIKHELTI